VTEETLRWHELTDARRFPRATGAAHRVRIKREAVPIIFVPGIMGSRLRHLDRAVWDPDNEIWVAGFALRSAASRREVLIGPGSHGPGWLQVDPGEPRDLAGTAAEQALRHARGWASVVRRFYEPFLHYLDAASFLGTLSRYFTCPVYAFGYNWTASNRHAGRLLDHRIAEIIAEHDTAETFCEKVLIVSHSMGGLASRAAMKRGGALSGDDIENPKVAGAIHVVQPVNGAAAAYKRMRAGFEQGSGIEGYVVYRLLGVTSAKVTAVLANAPGGLELLPTKNYRTNAGDASWMTAHSSGAGLFDRPDGAPADPYAEIYRQKDVWWRLVDEAHIDPGGSFGRTRRTPWLSYLENLREAELFHDGLRHASLKDRTYQLVGTGGTTSWDRIGHRLLTRDWLRRESSLSADAEAEIRRSPGTHAMKTHDDMECTFDVSWTERAPGRGPPTQQTTEVIARMDNANASGDGTVPEASGRGLPSVLGTRQVAGIAHDACFSSGAVRTQVGDWLADLLLRHAQERIGTN